MSKTGSQSLLSPCDVGQPWLDMAASVLVRAFMDWDTYGQAMDCTIGDKRYACLLRLEFGFGSPYEELVAFFTSDWFQFLLGGFSVDDEAVMEELARRGMPG